MKIITMERRTLDGEAVEYSADENGEDYRDWWCIIETKEEELVCDKAHTEGEYAIYEKLWDSMINLAGEPFGLTWGDDEVYGYIRPDEMPPEIGDEYIDGDNDKWIRVE